MKFIKKYAKFVGYRILFGQEIAEWTCPNKKCGMGVSEEYICCPYCGQKIKFKEPEQTNMIEIYMKEMV